MNIFLSWLFCCIVHATTTSPEEAPHRTLYDSYVNVKAALARTRGGSNGEKWPTEADAAIQAEDGGSSSATVIILLLLLGLGYAGYRYREEIRARFTAMTSSAPITTQHND